MRFHDLDALPKRHRKFGLSLGAGVKALQEDVEGKDWRVHDFLTQGTATTFTARFARMVEADIVKC